MGLTRVRVGRPLAAGRVLQRLTTGYLESIYRDTVRGRYASQRALLDPDDAAILVDIGCHGGENTLRLARAVGTSRAVGIDIHTAKAREAHTRGVRVVVADANRPLPLASGSATVLTAMDVLEHLVDPAMLISEAYRVLRPGGYLVLATPNLASWHNIFALVLGFQPFSGPNLTSMLDADFAVVRSLHRRAYHLLDESVAHAEADAPLHRHLVVSAYRSLLRLIRDSGFAIERAKGHGYYPLPPWLARLAARVDPAHAHHLVIKARKPQGET